MSGTKPDVTEPSGDAAPLGPSYWKLWTASVISNLGDGVGAIAYPWLASAVTRNGVLIALVAVAQRLPWLVFTLPAGVITDRRDRRALMVSMDALRAVATAVVAVAVLVRQDVLPAPESIGGALVGTDAFLYAVLVLAAFLLGLAEVLRDNAAQTILPAIVEPEGLERANARMWGIEMVANSFVGPPLGSFLLGVAFALPFLFDAGTFALSAGLVFLIAGDFRTRRRDETEIDWRGEIAEGFGWLWRHPLLRPMAIILGLLNGLAMVTFATFVLFAQEILATTPLTFAVLMTGAAVGGLLATLFAARVAKRLGSGPSLHVVLMAGVVFPIIIGTTSLWPVVWVVEVAFTFAAVLWNVITVSLRQTIIPDDLLGRVNSVYRFFGWGMMPIGSLAGGAIVVLVELFASRELALRMPWLLTAVAYAALFLYAAPRLTTEKIEEARADGIAAKESAVTDAAAESGVPGAPPPGED